ncbi:MAG: ArnT family glycosyltransferase [Chloroflexia bacterium]
MLHVATITEPAVEVTGRQSGAKRIERLALWGLVALSVASSCGFALVTPYGEAPDEPSHFLYIDWLVRFGTLPFIGKDPYTVDSFHPPLYYTLGAAMPFTVRKITGAQMEKPLGPFLYNNDRFRADGMWGYNRMLHPANERWPVWPYTLRVLSILMGVGVVLLTYATTRALVPAPASAVAPLTATAFAALIPQANFIRASISNENLAALMGAVIIWLLVLHLTRPHSTRRVVLIGAAYGLALLTKLSLAPFLLPILWVLWLRRRPSTASPDTTRYSVLVTRSWRDLVAFGVPVLALAGWYYAYRWGAYGDPLATNAWHAMLPSDSDFHLSDLFWFNERFRFFLWTSFWATYGWQNMYMPGWTYNVFLAVTVLGVIGGAYLVARRALTAAQQAGSAVMLSALLLMYALVIQASTYLIAWQGREMVPALSSTCVLFGLGLAGLVLGRGAVQPIPLAPWRRYLGVALVLAVTAGLLAANVYSIFWVVLPGLNTY